MRTWGSILLDEKYFWISFHDVMALLIKAFSTIFFGICNIKFKNSYEEQDVSESEEKVNQWLEIDGISKLIDLLIKRQFQ